MLEQQRQMTGKHGRARAAGGKARHFAAQVGFETGQADVAVARDRSQVAPRLLDQAQEQMLDVDFVLAQPDTDARPRAWPPRGWCR